MRPKGMLWAQFEVMVRAGPGSMCRVRCKHCPWTGSGNTTRMKLHISECHAQLSMGDGTEEEEEAVGDDSSQAQSQPASPLSPAGSPFTSMGPSDGASSAGSTVAVFQGKAMEWAKRSALQARRDQYAAVKKRRLDLTAYMDRTFSGSEQAAAARAQLLMVVLAGLSFNSQEAPATLQFYRKLRPDYRPQSRHMLQKALIPLEVEVRASVIADLVQQPHVSLAFDGWEDHQRCPTAGWTIITPDMRTYLWKFVRMNDKQTGENLLEEIKLVVGELADLKIRVVSGIADNASNVQKALALAEAEIGLLRTKQGRAIARMTGFGFARILTNCHTINGLPHFAFCIFTVLHFWFSIHAYPWQQLLRPHPQPPAGGSWQVVHHHLRPAQGGGRLLSPAACPPLCIRGQR